VTQLLLATTNPGKVKELIPLLDGLGWDVCGLELFPQIPEAVEDGATFSENAQIKALHFAAATGLAVLADDSGLEVDALGGAPGVHSARFAGEHGNAAANNALLLERLAAASDRSARFRCSLCLVEDGQVTLELSGSCEGTILENSRGAEGFGYDPLFVPRGANTSGATFAEMTSAQKAGLSHRGQAMAAFANELARRAAGAPS
jgi:XTP/dITP diphosphohydrolase